MASPDRGRVTAGLPALSPSLRFAADKRETKERKIRAIHRQLETSRDDAVKPDGDRDRSDKQASIGTPLHSAKIMARLMRLNPSLIFQHHPFLPRFQVFIKDRFVCAFEDNYSPQFEVLLWHWEEHVKGYGKEAYLEKVKVLDDTVRGWVTLLDILIRQKLITKAGAEREFGPVHSLAHKTNTAGY